MIGQPATPRQLMFIRALQTEAGMDDDEAARDVGVLYGATMGELTRLEASRYIDTLQRRAGRID